MKELFAMVLDAPVSKKHKLSFDFTTFQGNPSCTIYVIALDGNGIAAGIVEKIETFYSSVETVKAWLSVWINRIAEECKNENNINSSEGSLDC